jgi:hypothetical protein
MFFNGHATRNILLKHLYTCELTPAVLQEIDAFVDPYNWWSKKSFRCGMLFPKPNAIKNLSKSMPPKRLTNLPANVFLDHVAPLLKTRNIARLNTATGGQIPGLANQTRKLDAERKQAALAIIKRQQHALARRIVTAMKGMRMAIRKKNSTNAKNRAWLNRYSNVYHWCRSGSARRFIKFRGFGGLEIIIEINPHHFATDWTIQFSGNTASSWWVYFYSDFPFRSKYFIGNKIVYPNDAESIETQRRTKALDALLGPVIKQVSLSWKKNGAE